MTAATTGARMPSSQAHDAVADDIAPEGQRGQHGQLAQEPRGQGRAPEPAQVLATRRRPCVPVALHGPNLSRARQAPGFT